MGLFNIFKRQNSDSNKKATPESGLNDIQENTVNKQDEANNNLVAAMPIDEIYKYLQTDFESRGYDDALCNPDISYRDMNKKLIVSNLRVLFKQVKQIYTDSLSNTEFHIKSRQQAGLIDIVELLKNRKDTLDSHLKEVEKMEQDLDKDEVYMVGMLLSYERGFLRGLAALSLETLNIKK
ncbi:MAG: hypothetical protein H6Q20_1306 [Bacteroidetes bacterium]|nr:hypothetical protein [Bacteroidota bacterium]